MNRTRRTFTTTLLAVAIPLLIAAPYLLPNLLRTKLNPEPLSYIAPEICSTAFALFIPTKMFAIFFWGFFVIGLLALSRRIKQPAVLLVFCSLFVTLGGQLLGYAQVLAGNRPDSFGVLALLPFALPHEFQWFFQLFALIPIAAGIAACSRIILKKHHLALDIALPLLLIVPGYIDLPKEQLKCLVLHIGEKPAYISWIEDNTPTDAVFVTSHPWTGYRELQPYTARKLLYHYPAHMNFNVDIIRRGDQKGRLLYHADEAEAERIISEYNLDFVVLNTTQMPADRLEFFNTTYATLYKDTVFSILSFHPTQPVPLKEEIP
jgi:hypothetical protein